MGNKKINYLQPNSFIFDAILFIFNKRYIKRCLVSEPTTGTKKKVD